MKGGLLGCAVVFYAAAVEVSASAVEWTAAAAEWAAAFAVDQAVASAAGCDS